jgi:hypothetical protein
VATYEEYLKPFRLISTLPRPVPVSPSSSEPADGDGGSAGCLMLFEAPHGD